MTENDDAKDVSSFITSRFLNWEQSDVSKAGYTLEPGRLGCTSLSVGSMLQSETRNAAWSVKQALDPVFKYFVYARSLKDLSTLAPSFAAAESKRKGQVVLANGKAGSGQAAEEEEGGLSGMFKRMLSGFTGNVKVCLFNHLCSTP